MNSFAENPLPRPLVRFCALALLVVHFAAGSYSLSRDAATFDETAHLAAGFSYLDRGDFRMNPEHPPLSKAWCALPLHLLDLAEGDYDSAAWREANQWLFGYEFLNGPRGQAERLAPNRLLVPARTAALCLSAALALIVFGWARELWGSLGGLFSLALYVLSPTMLAHGRLVTTDTAIALAYAATLWSLWRALRAPSWHRQLLCGACLAAALLIKFSALLLAFIVLVLILADTLRSRAPWRRTAGTLAALALIGYVAIWAGYGFRYSATTDPDYTLDWEVIGPTDNPLGAVVEQALERKLLPEGYLYGLSYFLGGAERRVGYLNGTTSVIGWWYYFPQAFLMKSSPALLLLLAGLIGSALYRRAWRAWTGWFLALPVLIYVGVSMAANLNIGQRHLLPVYPLLFVALGSLPARLARRRAAGAILALLLIFHAATFAAASPRYLSYFNRLAGGSQRGARYLLDSNLDWGQDLRRLAQWSKAAGSPELFLAYFGTADPAAYGLRYRKLLMVHDFHPERPSARPKRGDLVAVSSNLLHGLYLDSDREWAEALVRRRWLDADTLREWVAYRDERSRSGQRHLALELWLERERRVTPRQLEAVRPQLLATHFEQLRQQPPLEIVGDSIQLYRWP